jgi:pimeloyl-ACP methyl ester carboxylesterase
LWIDDREQIVESLLIPILPPGKEFGNTTRREVLHGRPRAEELQERYARRACLSTITPFLRPARVHLKGTGTTRVSSSPYLDRCSIKVLSALFKIMNETDFRPELRTIRTPRLILQGNIDKSAPLELHGRATHEFIAGSQLVVYENAAHGLPYTHTDRMLADIVALASA